jgi:hypothetical protein
MSAPTEVDESGSVAPLPLVDEVVLDLGGEGGRDGPLVLLDAALGESRPQPADRVLELDQRAERVDRDRVDSGGATGKHPGGVPGRLLRAPGRPGARRG